MANIGTPDADNIVEGELSGEERNAIIKTWESIPRPIRNTGKAVLATAVGAGFLWATGIIDNVLVDAAVSFAMLGRQQLGLTEHNIAQWVKKQFTKPSTN